MSTKTFVGDLADTTGQVCRMEIVVNLDAAHQGKFQYTISGDPFRLRKVRLDDYLAWIKTVLSQISTETGKSIFYAGENRGVGIIITAEPDGSTKETREKI